MYLRNEWIEETGVFGEIIAGALRPPTFSLFFCQNRFLYFVENCVISTPIILQCRSVADLYWGGGVRTERIARGASGSSSSALEVAIPAAAPPTPSCITLFAFLFFFFLASQSSEQRTCLFLLSLCDSVVRLSIVYKKNSLSYLTFSPSLSLARPRILILFFSRSRSLSLPPSPRHGALERTWLAFEMCNFASATRLSPSAARTRAISSFFSSPFPASSPFPSACYLATSRANLLFFSTSFEMRFSLSFFFL